MIKMDKNFLREHNLLETQKRFQQICEYTFYSNSKRVDEEGEEEQQDPNAMDNGNTIPQDTNAMGDGNAMPQDTNAMSQDPNDMVDVPMEENMPLDPNGLPMDDPNGMGVDTLQSGDEVIDVDNLTQSQQAAEIKIDDVDEKLTTLLNVVNKFAAAIEQNDQKIMDLKSEIEKRNPTEEEKLNLRSQAAYPYNVQPKSYWDEKTKNSNYKVTYDNEIPTADEDKDNFTFTKKDLKGINDSEIAKTLDDYQLKDFIKF